MDRPGGVVRRVAGKAGVADGDIQLAEGLDCAVDQGLDVAGDADIRPEVFGLRPSALSLAANALPSSSRRPETTIAAPWRAKAVAVARPMPASAP